MLLDLIPQSHTAMFQLRVPATASHHARSGCVVVDTSSVMCLSALRFSSFFRIFGDIVRSSPVLAQELINLDVVSVRSGWADTPRSAWH